jgi:catalase
VGSLSKVPVEIQKKMVEHFTRADPNYGGGSAKGLGLA